MNRVKFPELFANISSLDFNEGENLLLIATNKGQLITYKCLDENAGLESFNFKLMEKFNGVENPHGDLDQSEEDRLATNNIYSMKSHVVKAKFARSLKSCYIYIIESL